MSSATLHKEFSSSSQLSQMPPDGCLGCTGRPVVEELSTKLAFLQERIAARTDELQTAKKERAEHASTATWSTTRLLYLSIAELLRKPVLRFGEGWHACLLAVGLSCAASICLLFSHALIGMPQWASLIILLASLIATFFVLLALLYVPATEELQGLAANARECRNLHAKMLVEIKPKIRLLTREIENLVRQQEDLMNSAQFQREQQLQRTKLRRDQLLNSNWRVLRDTEFEKFLKEVFVSLGAQVELTPVTGDKGIDLVVTLNERRIAVQAKGYSASVGSSAVQEAVAGRKPYNCHICAVITNSTFTKNAIALADDNSCVMIDESALSLLIMRGDPFVTFTANHHEPAASSEFHRRNPATC